MDVESGPHEGAAHPQGGELLTISTDGIEVFMPSKISQAIRDIQKLDEKIASKLKDLRKEVRSKKDATAQDEVNWFRERGRDKDFDQLAAHYHTKPDTDTSENVLERISRDEKNAICGEEFDIYIRKRREFAIKLNLAVIKCKRNYSFYFHIVFFVFDSANLAEIADYSLAINETINKKLSGDQHTKKSEALKEAMNELPDELFVSIDCEMDAKSVIDKLHQELQPLLAPFKSLVVKGSSAALPETCTWVTVLFQTQFYLSQIDMDTVLQFLAQEHFTPQLRFILVFKKLKDAESLTPGKKCMLYQEPIEKHANYTYEFFKNLISVQNEVPRTHIPPSLMGDLIQYHEDYRFHVSMVISHVLGLLSLHYAHLSMIPKAARIQEEPSLPESTWKAGMRFFNKLINRRATKNDKSEESRLLIDLNEVQFYADPKHERFPASAHNDPEPKSGSRFRMVDLALAFMEPDGDYLERLIKNCQELIKEYEVHTKKLRRSQFNSQDFVDKLQKVVNKVKHAKDAKSMNFLPTKDSVFDRKKTDIERPKDAQERMNQVIQSTQANPDSQVASGDKDFVDGIKLELVSYLEEEYTKLIEVPIQSMSATLPHKVLSNHRDFEALLNPNIVDRYVRHLRNIGAAKPAADRKSSSMETPLNVAELATKVMFELFANGPILIQVEEVIGPFTSRMQQIMTKFGIRIKPVQDSSSLSQQASCLGGAQARDALIQLGFKYLFYYAINTLKRAGLIEEFNKSKRVVKKRFFKEMSFLDNS